MNRSVHKRTSEGDGEEPSRHENHGPLLMLFLHVRFMMDARQRRTSKNSCNSKASTRPETPLLTYLLTSEINEKVIAHKKRRTPPYAFLEFTFVQSHFKHVGTRRWQGS